MNKQENEEPATVWLYGETDGNYAARDRALSHAGEDYWFWQRYDAARYAQTVRTLMQSDASYD